MADIDLIPPSYRRARRMRGWVRWALITYVLALVSIGVLKVMLVHSVGSRSAEVEMLKIHKGQHLDKARLVRELEAERSQLHQRTAALDRLRGGTPIRVIFAAIDQSLDDGIWFLRWKFLRAGEFMEVPRAARQRLLVEIAPRALDQNETDWRDHSHMSINARAQDHATLAKFASRLEAQPAIQAIKVLNTRTTTDGSVQAVDFDLMILVKDSL